MNLLEKEIELYRNNKENIVKYVRKNGLKSLSFLCATTQFNLIIAYHYVLEEFPEHKEECERKIRVLKEFYGY